MSEVSGLRAVRADVFLASMSGMCSSTCLEGFGTVKVKAFFQRAWIGRIVSWSRLISCGSGFPGGGTEWPIVGADRRFRVRRVGASACRVGGCACRVARCARRLAASARRVASGARRVGGCARHVARRRCQLAAPGRRFTVFAGREAVWRGSPGSFSHDVEPQTIAGARARGANCPCVAADVVSRLSRERRSSAPGRGCLSPTVLPPPIARRAAPRRPVAARFHRRHSRSARRPAWPRHCR